MCNFQASRGGLAVRGDLVALSFNGAGAIMRVLTHFSECVHMRESDESDKALTACTHVHAHTETEKTNRSACPDSFAVTSSDPVPYAASQHLAKSL